MTKRNFVDDLTNDDDPTPLRTFLYKLSVSRRVQREQTVDEEEARRSGLQVLLLGEQANGSAQPLFPEQAERYRWNNWRFKSGSELMKFVRDEVFPYMASLVKEAPDAACPSAPRARRAHR